MALKINSGDLRHSIVLKYSIKGQNNQGGKTLLEWIVGIKTSAAIYPVSNSRINEANASAMLDSKDFYIRWAEERKQIDKNWVIEYDSKVWQINSVENINEKQRFIRLNAKVKSG